MDTGEFPLDVDIHHVAHLIAQQADFLFVDCRTPAEHAVASIPQAQLIPMSQIPERLAELEPYRHVPIVIHCHHGGRSRRVAEWLRENGFCRAQNMVGGIDAWAVEIDPSLPRY